MTRRRRRSCQLGDAPWGSFTHSPRCAVDCDVLANWPICGCDSIYRDPVDEVKRRAWDVFVSHASEDKDGFVRPLVREMSRLGLRTWYDEFSLRPGDSLSENIDRGLDDSDFGLVVISRSFMTKRWPRRELAGLTAGELGRDQVIIPVWLDVTLDEVLAFSPTLADKLAIVADSGTPDATALRVLERVRPDLHQEWHRRMAFDQMAREGEPTRAPISDLAPGPIRHASLPPNMLVRLRLIRESLLEVFPVSWTQTIDNFRRDMHPDRELAIWEFAAGIYLAVRNEFELDLHERQRVYSEIFSSVLLRDELEVRPQPDTPWLARTRELCASVPLERFGSLGERPASTKP